MAARSWRWHDGGFFHGKMADGENPAHGGESTVPTGAGPGSGWQCFEERIKAEGKGGGGDRRTLAQLALDPEIAFGDAYSDGRVQVEGDLVAFLEEVMESMRHSEKAGWFSRLRSWWLDRVDDNSTRG